MIINQFKTFTIALALLFSSVFSMAEQAPFTVQTQRYYSSTKVIIQSKTDNLLVEDVSVNRGQCRIEVSAPPVVRTGESYMDAINNLKAGYHGFAQKSLGAFYDEKVAEKDLERATNLFLERRELKFSQVFTPVANCRPEEILEISVITNKGSWTFGQ
ncbi:hypothetical protein [Mannheimia indoligenes]|uniref:hypothetical protein n=1 Tax=Mannheimia indoligenes TaxID=3103145 RepID=UPI002FE6B888